MLCRVKQAMRKNVNKITLNEKQVIFDASVIVYFNMKRHFQELSQPYISEV